MKNEFVFVKVVYWFNIGELLVERCSLLKLYPSNYLL